MWSTAAIEVDDGRIADLSVDIDGYDLLRIRCEIFASRSRLMSMVMSNFGLVFKLILALCLRREGQLCRYAGFCSLLRKAICVNGFPAQQLSTGKHTPFHPTPPRPTYIVEKSGAQGGSGIWMNLAPPPLYCNVYPLALAWGPGVGACAYFVFF